MTDIFTEVAEDLRRERAKRLWDRYGWIATAALLLVVAGTAGFQGWKWYQQRQALAASDRYTAVVQTEPAGDSARSVPALEALRREGPAGYALLARFQEAAARARSGDRDGAIALWQGIAADSSISPVFRDLASVTAILHEIDSGEPSAIAPRLAALDRPDGTFRFSARELQAALALRQGQTQQAMTILRRIAEAEDAPMALRERAAETLGALTTSAAGGT